MFRSHVIFLVPLLFWKGGGDVSLGFGAAVAGLGCILPRGPGSGEGVATHESSQPLLRFFRESLSLPLHSPL